MQRRSEYISDTTEGKEEDLEKRYMPKLGGEGLFVCFK